MQDRKPSPQQTSAFRWRIILSAGLWLSIGMSMMAGAQTAGSGQNAAASAPPASSASSTATAAAPAPSLHQPPPALAAARQIILGLNNPKTFPSQPARDARNYARKYPHSPWLEAVDFYVMEYYRTHQMYPQMFEFGHRILRTDPKAIIVLTQLASIIPSIVRPSDLNRDQMLRQAHGYATRALADVMLLKPRSGPQPLSPAVIQSLQQQVRAVVLSTYGRIDLVKKHFHRAAAHFRQAIPFDAPAPAAVDYYRLCQALQKAGDIAGARAALEKAKNLGTNNSELQALVAIKEKQLAALSSTQSASRATAPPAAAEPRPAVNPAATPAPAKPVVPSPTPPATPPVTPPAAS